VSPYRWGWDAEALGLVPALSLAYLLALRRFPASRPRVAAFFAGQLLILAVFFTPVQTLALHYLLTMHLLQNVVLAEWAPALLVVGLAPALAARLARPRAVRLLTSPFMALPIWLAVYFAWHLPWPYDTALRHPSSILHVEHVSYLVAGCLVWWPVLQDVPRLLSPAAKAVYLFAAFVLASPLGLLLALLPRPLYDVYEHAPTRLWGLSAATDQQLAGITMASEQAIVFFAVFTFFFLRFLRDEEPVLQLDRATATRR
jgi:cytochrome c oxidase assembly factor CtaG